MNRKKKLFINGSAQSHPSFKLSCNKLSIEYLCTQEQGNFYIEVSFHCTLKILCLSQGWKRYGFHCYLVGSALLTFSEANKTCEQSKAYLATVESRWENNFKEINTFNRETCKTFQIFEPIKVFYQHFSKNFIVARHAKIIHARKINCKQMVYSHPEILH